MKVINTQIIGQRVKEIRLQNHISQAKLAEQVNLSATYISRIETAKKQASLKSLILISNALGVTVDSLLYGNQANSFTDYQSELSQLLKGCDNYEKRIVYEIALATRRSLVKNRELL